MSNTVTRPPLETVMTCRPPLVVSSSEKWIEPLAELSVMSTCTEPPERTAACAARRKADGDRPPGDADGDGAPGDDATAVGAAAAPAAAAAVPVGRVGALVEGEAVLLPPLVQPARRPTPASIDRVRAAPAARGRWFVSMDDGISRSRRDVAN